MKRDDRTSKVVDIMPSIHPNATTDLSYSNELEFLVAVILSAQTSDRAVNLVTSDLFEKYRTARDYENADPKELEDIIRPLGLQARRSKILISLGNEINARFSGKIPHDLKGLTSLPGVGRKTAEVFLSVIAKQNHFAVDTHIARVAKRLKFAFKKDTVLAVEKKMTKKIGERGMVDFRYSMLEFAKNSCTARNPKCDGCPLKEFCRYPHHMFEKK
jgi:endonuclease III